MLPTLVRKAIGDAGFDLLLGSEGEWERIGISGVPVKVWVVPARGGALIALADQRIIDELATAGWTDVPLPDEAKAGVRCQTPRQLFEVLGRIRIVATQLPPVPAERYAHALAKVDSTERTAIVKQRVGQEIFRVMLLEYWEGCCAVTGLAVPELLRASHAKPWADSNDEERLDVFNGFLLAVHLDALFDRGFMTFNEDGDAVFSSHLPADARQAIGVGDASLRLVRIAEAHRPYLLYHREHVFRRTNG